MNLRILSLGAGVQSSTLALMIEKGEIPMVAAGIFADTQAESKETMEFLRFKQILKGLVDTSKKWP